MYSQRGTCWACRFGKVVPQEIKTLIEECWDPQPDKRPSFAKAAQRLQVCAADI